MNGAALYEQATFVTERAWEYASSTTSIFNRARSLVAGDAQFFSVAPKVDDLRRSLNSEALHDKRDAMKRIVAQMCKGSDMRHFFTDVVKNIHVPSIELRKLIYLFIVYYAEDCPDETLLSISAFQKDLVDPSMHVRALALRMLAALRIPAIQPVVMVAVRKCADDFAPVVRKTAALALVQMHSVARNDLDNDGVQNLLRTLLSDRNPDVVGAASMAFTVVCPTKWELLHPVYRRLCRILVACEEWGQVVLLRLLLRYARLHFVDPSGPYAGKGEAERGSGDEVSSSSSGSDDDDEDATSSSASSFDEKLRLQNGANTGVSDADRGIDVDLLLLLNSARPLLRSMNSAVVVATIALYTHCGTRRFHAACAKPAMRLLNTCAEGHIAILNVIYALLLLHDDAFRPYYKSFFLLPLDSADVRRLKLRILARLVTPMTAEDVFREFRSYVHQWNDAAVVEAIQGLGLVVQQYPPFATHTIRLITPLLSSTTSSPAVVAEAVTVLRVLVLQGTDPVRISRLVCRLTLDIMENRITEPSAVATILWLAGENISKHASMAAAAPDCFRVFAKRFGSLAPEVKRQVLALGCKVWVYLQGNSELAERFKQVYFYVAELAKYDDDYSIRDDERLVEATFDRQSDTFTAVRTALLRDKPLPDAVDPYAERTHAELGTYSQLLGPSVRGCQPLPAWSTEPSSPTLRRSVEDTDAAAAAVAIFESTSEEDEESGSDESDTASSTSSADDDSAASRSASSTASSSGSYESSDTDSRDASEKDGDNKKSSHSGSASEAAAPAKQHRKHRTGGKKGTAGGAAVSVAAAASPPKATVRVTMRSSPTPAAAAPASVTVEEETVKAGAPETVEANVVADDAQNDAEGTVSNGGAKAVKNEATPATE
ncbi:putative adaptin [Leptomonas pyrrhocoris]|uniref:Putative adaptin n=1 Tax=Leptomonas pyrrhocoris TaxID=157538 RepID=A0A0M9G3V0_LEPPY|nr:putative adaptin [Leptomonas pyrrhocoris]XP_015660049.1 putative adaptin [Leptomonas pyrrhocoris]KPA81609.1 putative adaptin [Leptomonas pyrrhocoris]KPA81610.1 putative adaptin [Leptomonas pyrrhocoris]|eukprot:XP_015660048.1 putative adaptin [Leptomonas pyrrhocoris]